MSAIGRKKRGRRRIGVVAPACPIRPETAALLAELAEAACSGRVELVIHPQCFLIEGHFAGSDAARTDAFLETANDPDIDAVWFARGGYGSCRLAEAAFAELGAAAHAKTYLGYSDLGTVLGRLYHMGVGRPVHGPMANDILRDGGEAAARALLYLGGDGRAGLEPSLAAGGVKAAAFNLTILAHLLAAPFAPDLAGHVVMLEEISEHHYRIDRALFSVVSSEKVRRAAGIRLGRCLDIPENDPPFARGEEDIARDWCGRSGIPYLGRADIGHDSGNKIVPFGAPLKA